MKHIIKSRTVERNRMYRQNKYTAERMFGIYWSPEARVWIPMVELKDDRRHLGTFDTLQQACNAQISAYYDLVDQGVIKKIPKKVWDNQPSSPKKKRITDFDSDVCEGIESEFLYDWNRYEYTVYITNEHGRQVRCSTHFDLEEAKKSYDYYMENLYPLIADIG